MALTIPNIENIPSAAASVSPYFDAQAVPDATDWAATAASEYGTGVLYGMKVVPLSPASMGASINPGNYLINGLAYGYGGGSVSVTAASVSDRRDIISIASASVVTVTAGTPCGTAGWTRTSSGLPPVKPGIPSNNALLGELYVGSTTTSIQGGNIVDKTTLVSGSPGSLLARAFHAPSSAGSYTPVVSTTGLTALDTTNLVVTFSGPPSGDVLVRLQGFCKGGAAAATKFIFGIVSTTASPGTVVGVTGLATLTPTATAADDGTLVVMEQLVTGLTVGTSYTWYFAAAYSGTAPTIIPQGPTVATTVPTGAPAGISVYAA